MSDYKRRELGILADLFADRDLGPIETLPDPHTYRAHRLADETWIYAKFSPDSQRWVAVPVTVEFLVSAHNPMSWLHRKLDQQLARLAGSEVES
jgi:hypothetical protein